MSMVLRLIFSQLYPAGGAKTQVNFCHWRDADHWQSHFVAEQNGRS